MRPIITHQHFVGLQTNKGKKENDFYRHNTESH